MRDRDASFSTPQWTTWLYLGKGAHVCTISTTMGPSCANTCTLSQAHTFSHTTYAYILFSLYLSLSHTHTHTQTHTNTRRTNGSLPCPAISPKMGDRFVLRKQHKATGVSPITRDPSVSSHTHTYTQMHTHTYILVWEYIVLYIHWLCYSQ